MSPVSPAPNREALGLALVLTTAAICLGAAEASSRFLRAESDGSGAEESWSYRAENVFFLPREPADLPPWRPGSPAVLMLGNSHTYTLPGHLEGEPLRVESGHTVLDELARRVDVQTGGGGVYYLLSYPNFVAFEMLVRSGQLLQQGYRPDVVAVGLTYRNFARGTDLRHQVRRTFAEPRFAERFEAQLEDRVVAAHSAVLEALRSEVRRQRQAAAQERQLSDADRVDRALNAALGREIALIGNSADLRARIYRRIAYGIDRLLVRHEGIDYSYGVVESDLAFNLHCLRALVDLFRARGAQVVLYLAPQRQDLPPLVDPSGEAGFLGTVNGLAAERGLVLVDARTAVPGELWGWDLHIPDRSHFTEPGHRILAALLLREGQRRNVWSHRAQRLSE